jgi:hypothetical protein
VVVLRNPVALALCAIRSPFGAFFLRRRAAEDAAGGWLATVMKTIQLAKLR